MPDDICNSSDGWQLNNRACGQSKRKRTHAGALRFPTTLLSFLGLSQVQKMRRTNRNARCIDPFANAEISVHFRDFHAVEVHPAGKGETAVKNHLGAHLCQPQEGK